MATVLAIAQIPQNDNDLSLKFYSSYEICKVLGASRKGLGVCFQAKLKGFRQGFKEWTWGCLQAKLKGFRQGFKEAFFVLRRGPGYAFKSSQTGLQGKDLGGG